MMTRNCESTFLFIQSLFIQKKISTLYPLPTPPAPHETPSPSSPASTARTASPPPPCLIAAARQIRVKHDERSCATRQGARAVDPKVDNNINRRKCMV